MICPKCGNRIQEWAHGVCYTCQRTEKERQRFGRRRPRVRNKGPGTRLSTLPETVTCSECGQRVRTVRYASHWRQVHGERSATSRVAKKRAARPREAQAKEFAFGAQKPRNRPDSKTPHNAVLAELRDEIAQKIEASRCLRRRKGINNLLKNIYGQSRLLSDILRDGGLSEREVDRLRCNHLDEFVAVLSGRWEDWWREVFTFRARDVLVQRYSLGGQPVVSTKALARKHHVTPEAIARSEISSIARLKQIARRRELEDIVLRTGREILSG